MITISQQELLGPSPWAQETMSFKMIVPNASYAVHFSRPQFGTVQTTFDGWPNETITDTLTVRLHTQDWCLFRCITCGAHARPKTTPPISLSAEMMLHQVVDPILKGWISLKGIEHINIYTMGFGEPLANRETTRAIKLFLQHFEQAKLMVSTMGPPNGDKVFEELLALSIAHNNLDLQWSIHFLKDPERLAYSGMNKTNALMPLEEVAKRIRRWTNSTKRKVYANFGFGPKYAKWTEEYLNLLPSLFPPTDIIAKLSLEGPEGGDRWNLADFAAQISTFEPLFNNLGYETLIYSPPGIEEGGSCGAHALELADTDRLVWPIT